MLRREADAGLEAHGLERGRGADVDGQIFHLLPVRAILAVVAGALVDDKRKHDAPEDSAVAQGPLKEAPARISIHD